MIEQLALNRAAAQQIDELDGQIAVLQSQKKDIYDNVKSTVSPATNKAWKAAVKLRQKRRDRSKRDEMEEHEILVFDILGALERPEIKRQPSSGTAISPPAGAEIVDPATGEITERTDHAADPARQRQHAGGVEVVASPKPNITSPADLVPELPPSAILPVDTVATAAGDSLTDQPSNVVGEEGLSLAAPELETPRFPKREKRASQYERPQYLGAG